jgi:hypothetical protein
MTNPKADQRARMSQLLPPGANVARPSIFTHNVRFPREVHRLGIAAPPSMPVA